MKPRRLIDSDVTPAGERIELAFEGGHYIIRVNGAPLMSSAMVGSEQAMASVAFDRVGHRERARVLVGGLGIGSTLRAVLDAFAPTAQVTVAELLPAVVRFNRGELGAVTDRPLEDPRVTLFEGDVRTPLKVGGWDAVLLDVDNGPEAFTVAGNAELYSGSGIERAIASLACGGVLVVWSAFASPAFVRDMKRLGLAVEARRVRARASGKGPVHTLFILAADSRH